MEGGGAKSRGSVRSADGRVSVTRPETGLVSVAATCLKQPGKRKRIIGVIGGRSGRSP